MVCLSSASCKVWSDYSHYTWISDSPDMQLQLYCNQYYGDLTFEDKTYRFAVSCAHDGKSLQAFQADSNDLTVTTLFYGKTVLNGDTLTLTIAQTTIDNLLGTEIMLTKKQPSDPYYNHSWASENPLFEINFLTNQGTLQVADAACSLIIDGYYYGLIVAYDPAAYPDEWFFSHKARPTQGLLFVCDFCLQDDTLTLTVIRSNIENLLGQTFVLTKTE